MLITTKTFELALYAQGDSASEKLAIVIPGRLDTKDYIHNTSLVNALAARGYYALSFDPPGTWESPGSIDLYTTSSCIKAVNELIEYYGNKPTVLAGHSRGGTVAMLVGPVHPAVTHFAAIFSYFGAPSDPEPERIENGALVSYRDLPPGTEKTDEQKRFDLPLSYFADGAQYDALPALRSCTKPKLFLYGMRDTMNDPEDVKKAYAESAEPKRMEAIDAEHDYRLSMQAVERVNSAVERFLDEA